MGVTPGYVKILRRQGYRNLTPKQLIKMKMFGVVEDDSDDDNDGP